MTPRTRLISALAMLSTTACIGGLEQADADDPESALAPDVAQERTSEVAIIDPEEAGVRWRGGIPADLVSSGLQFLSLQDCSVATRRDENVWFTPSLPLSLMLFQDPDRNPIAFPFPNRYFDVPLGSVTLSLQDIALKTDWAGQRIVDVSTEGSDLVLHAAFSGWIFADGSTFVDDQDVVLDNVDVRIYVSTNHRTGEFFVRDVKTATSYHLEGVSVIGELYPLFFDYEVPQRVHDAIKQVAESKLREAHIQQGIANTLTELQNRLSDELKIPMPRVNVYPGSIFLSAGNLCLSGYICSPWGDCPADDPRVVEDRTEICQPLKAVADAAKQEWEDAKCTPPEPGEPVDRNCAGEAARRYADYLRAQQAWQACMDPKPTCDPANPSTY